MEYIRPITINKGESLELVLEYSDPVNLVGIGVGIKEAKPLALLDATVTKIDEANGLCKLYISQEISDKLMDGENNWFRVELTYPNGQNSVSPQIWIKVQ